MADVMRWYNTVNAALLDHLTNQIKETDNSGVWRYIFMNRKEKKNSTKFNKHFCFKLIFTIGI